MLVAQINLLLWGLIIACCALSLLFRRKISLFWHVGIFFASIGLWWPAGWLVQQLIFLLEKFGLNMPVDSLVTPFFTPAWLIFFVFLTINQVLKLKVHPVAIFSLVNIFPLFFVIALANVDK